MNETTPAHADSLVSLHGDRPVTNSLIIAEKFDRPHDSVLKAIRAVMADCPSDFNLVNFNENQYYDQKGRAQPLYELTEKAFALVAMGFVGPRFIEWKIAFLDEFERRGVELTARDAALSAAARAELLKANPLWAAIARYAGLGLNQVEIARLTGHGREAVRKNRRRMEACGLIAPPANLAAMQQLALPLIGGAQ